MSDLQARIAAELHTAMDVFVAADSRRQEALRAFHVANRAAGEAQAECDRLICAAAALRGDSVPEGKAMESARRVELMAHKIKGAQ